mgnify:CR=1 FL=1
MGLRSAYLTKVGGKKLKKNKPLMRASSNDKIMTFARLWNGSDEHQENLNELHDTTSHKLAYPSLMCLSYGIRQPIQ